MEREILMMRAPGVPRVVRVRFPLVAGSTPAIVGPKLSNFAPSSKRSVTTPFQGVDPGSNPGGVTKDLYVCLVNI